MRQLNVQQEEVIALTILAIFVYVILHFIK